MKDSPENLLLVFILLEVDGDWLAAPDVGPGGRSLDPQDRDIPGHPKIHPEVHLFIYNMPLITFSLILHTSGSP